MFTQRAGLLGFVAFCFYLIAVVNSLPGFYYLLSWMSLGLLAASLGIAFLSLIGLDSQWRLGQTKGYASWNNVGASEGETGEIPTLLLTLHNKGTLNKTGLILEIQFRTVGGIPPTSLQGARRKWKRRRNQEDVTAHRYLLEVVPSGSNIEVSLPLYHLPRGRHEVVGLSLLGSDVLGLFRTRKRLAKQSEGVMELTVGPPISMEAPTIHAAGRGHLATGSHRLQRFGVGDEIRGTRAYVPGDDLRHVHWKSTARAGELVVREWEHTGHSAVLVVWDGANGTTWGRGQFDTTEIGLSLVASLCATLTRAGMPCALSCLGAEALYLEPSERTGPHLLSDLQFKSVASAVATRQGAAMPALDAASRGQYHDYDVVFWVTASLSPALPDAIRRQGNRVQTRLALIDGAALLEWTTGTRADKKAVEPILSNEKGAGIPVTTPSYDAQERALREAGAFVVRVAPHAAAEVPLSLRNAIDYLVEPV